MSLVQPPSGLIRLGTVSAAASLDLADIRGFRHYQLWLDGFMPATDEVGLYMLSSTDNGSTWGTSYLWARNNSASSIGNTATGSDGANTEIELTGAVDNVLTNGVTGIINIFKPAAAYRVTYTWQLACHAGNILQSVTGSAEVAASADVDALQLKFSSGNIASGNWALYGWR